MNSEYPVKNLLTIFFISLLCPACCTKVLWSAADSNKVIWANESTLSEQELKAKKVEYHRCEDRILGTGYVIKKTSMEKLRDYSVITLGTPMTLVFDGVTIVVQAVLSNPQVIPDAALQVTIDRALGSVVK